MWPIVRAVCFGAICALAVSTAAALRVQASTPEGRAVVHGWMSPVPVGWPAQPWPEARVDRSWARQVWELRGDPPFSGGRHGDGFSAQWVLRTGWPLPALQCVRSRLRTLWDQGVAARSPVEGESESWSEGIRVAATSIGGDDGFMLVPVTPIWWGLVFDAIIWAIPIYAIGVASRRLSAARRGRRRLARESAMETASSSSMAPLDSSAPAPPADRSSG